MRLRATDTTGVPTVDSEHIVALNDELTESIAQNRSDVAIRAVGQSKEDLSRVELEGLFVRYFAMHHFIRSGEGRQWVFEGSQEGFISIAEAMLKAAARAPLGGADDIWDCTFEPRMFLALGLEEAGPLGNG